MRTPVALFTVFYPNVESYLNDFLSSLSRQTYKDFDLVVVNDGFKSEYKKLFPDLNIIELKSESTISKNRECGISYIKNSGYQYMVLCDADDYFSEDRVELSINNLIDCDIVVNDVDIVSLHGNTLIDSYFSKRLLSEDFIDSNFIREKNLLGFSNTAIKLEKIWDISFPKDLQIVDWFFYTILLEQKMKVKFIPQTLTFYRQHSDNLIGIDDFSLELFRRMLDLKIAHYCYLSEVNPVYKTLYSKYLEMKNTSDIDIVNNIDKNREYNKFPLWWENIKCEL